jgi:hypothetical protein
MGMHLMQGAQLMNSITIIGIIGLFLATNFIWYWQGYKDGRREGWHKGRSLARSLADHAS